MAFSLLRPSRHDVYDFIDPTKNLKGAMTGKRILVTGSGSGIGRGIAQSFALAGAASLVLVGRRPAPLEETQALIADLVPDCQVTLAPGTDVSDREAVEKLFEDHDNLPDVIVSNAAASTSDSVADSDPDSWWRTMDINVRSPYLMARAYIRAVRASGQKGGRIINISSNAAWRVIPGYGLSSYSASKAALNNLTEHIDIEEEAAGSGVRCVAVHPGGVLTEMAKSSGVALGSLRALMIDTPALSGGTCVFVSTERAEFLMGRFLSSTWDMEELEKVKGRVVEEDLLKGRVLGVA